MALVTVYTPEGVAQQVETVDAREMIRYNGYTLEAPEPKAEAEVPAQTEPPEPPAPPAEPVVPVEPVDPTKPWLK